MRLTVKLPLAFMLITGLFNNAFAFSSSPIHEEICKPPKMLEFSLPEYSQPERHEVAPESEFSFKLSGGTPAEKIQVLAKHKPLPVDIKSNSSFSLVKGKLPAEYNGQYVRIDVIVKTELGCMSRDGWLIKVSAPN